MPRPKKIVHSQQLPEQQPVAPKTYSYDWIRLHTGVVVPGANAQQLRATSRVKITRRDGENFYLVDMGDGLPYEVFSVDFAKRAD